MLILVTNILLSCGTSAAGLSEVVISIIAIRS